MNTDALRTWGLAASAAVFASALTIAALGGCEPVREAPRVEEPASPTMASPDDEPVAEPSAAEGPPPPQTLAPVRARPSFVVRFEQPHPLARAQEIAARGRIAEARRAALATLNSQRNLRGLCFERFTLGGAEMVLSACEPVTNASAFETRWTRDLNAMAGVAYAEPNAVAQPEMRSAP